MGGEKKREELFPVSVQWLNTLYVHKSWKNTTGVKSKQTDSSHIAGLGLQGC